MSNYAVVVLINFRFPKFCTHQTFLNHGQKNHNQKGIKSSIIKIIT